MKALLAQRKAAAERAAAEAAQQAAQAEAERQRLLAERRRNKPSLRSTAWETKVAQRAEVRLRGRCQACSVVGVLAAGGHAAGSPSVEADDEPQAQVALQRRGTRLQRLLRGQRGCARAQPQHAQQTSPHGVPTISCPRHMCSTLPSGSFAADRAPAHREPPPPRAAILQAEDAFLEASIGKAAPSRRHPAGGENAVRGAAGQVAGLNMLNRRRRGGRVPAARQHSLGHGIPPKLEF